MDTKSYDDFMELALREAELAFEKGEVPIGAVIVFENKIVGRGHNLTESLHDATAHAEIIALSAAFEHFGDWRLENCVMISTIEPCVMCASAAVLSRIKTIVYGAKDPKFGGCGSILSIPTERKLNHQCEIVSGVRESESADIMKLFFRQIRDKSERVN